MKETIVTRLKASTNTKNSKQYLPETSLPLCSLANKIPQNELSQTVCICTNETVEGDLLDSIKFCKLQITHKIEFRSILTQ